MERSAFGNRLRFFLLASDNAIALRVVCSDGDGTLRLHVGTEGAMKIAPIGDRP